jgi:hypothetical protein
MPPPQPPPWHVDLPCNPSIALEGVAHPSDERGEEEHEKDKIAQLSKGMIHLSCIQRKYFTY